MAVTMRSGATRKRRPVRKTPYWRSLARPVQRRLIRRDRRNENLNLRQVVRRYRRAHSKKSGGTKRPPAYRHILLPTEAPSRVRHW